MIRIFVIAGNLGKLFYKTFELTPNMYGEKVVIKKIYVYHCPIKQISWIIDQNL